MRKVLSRSVLGAIVGVLAIAPASAQAVNTNGPVSVRVEGASATLIPPTVVATQSKAYTPFGKAHACPGTSAAEALDLATLANSTTWDGTFFSFGDYLITSIAGEAHPTGPSDGSYWNFWYDHTPAQLGVCGQQLNSNDEILFFPDCFSPCPAGFVSPDVLGMTAPTIAQKGSPVPVSVTSYASADGAPSPASGATVSGTTALSATGTNGAANLTFPSVGTFVIRATAPHSIRSEPHTVCVHDGDDGNCGTPAPPAATSTTTTTSGTTNVTPVPAAASGPDKSPPHGHLAIKEGMRFARGHGPHLIAGTVDSDPSGLRQVAVRLTRLVGRDRCEAYNAKRRKFVHASCGIAHAPSFSVGHAFTFAYLLPGLLGPGRYTVQVSAVDTAGNQDGPAPGRNRIVFRVE